jgi:hypothetical protein
VKAGELVVLVNDVHGVAAGKKGRVMSVREDAVLVESVTGATAFCAGADLGSLARDDLSALA